MNAAREFAWRAAIGFVLAFTVWAAIAGWLWLMDGPR